MGKSDPYVRFDFATDLTTSVIDNNNNPQWDECFLVADDGRTPLHFTVFDSDAGVVVDGSDDFLGECVVDQTNVPADGRWHALSAHLMGKKAKGSLELAVCRWPAGAAQREGVHAFGLKTGQHVRARRPAGYWAARAAARDARRRGLGHGARAQADPNPAQRDLRATCCAIRRAARPGRRLRPLKCEPSTMTTAMLDSPGRAWHRDDPVGRALRGGREIGLPPHAARKARRCS